MKSRRKVVEALLFVFLLASLAFFSVGCASAATHYVNPGESIQAAVNAADPDDTIIVRDGIYTENINVNNRLTIQSENGSANCIIQAEDSHDHVFEVKADYVNISGFTVEGATDYSSGIYFYHAEHCTISNNKANSNYNGIDLWDSNNNNRLTNNTVSNNSYYGISLRMSSNNTLTNNTMSGNKYNFGICCVSLSDYIQNIDPSNKVNGRSIYYLVNQQNQQIPDDAGFVGLINSTNIIVRDLILTNNRDGVLLFYSNNSRIENVTVSGNNYGIRLYYSNNNTLTNNTANSNDYSGIYLSSSSNNTMFNNNASNNEDNGIRLCPYSNNNVITNNIANSNKMDGILFLDSSNNSLINNTNNLNVHGIWLQDSSNNTIINNNCSNNNNGIHILWDSSNNTLINNTANSNKGCGLVIYGANNTLKNNAIAGSKYNFRAEGIQDIDTSNTVNGKPIRYLVHEKDLIIDSSFDVGYLGIVNSRNITVRDLILTNNLEGILLDHSSDSKIENVTILNCETGIYLKSTSNNAVTNNNASNNYITGIYLQNASDNFISNNNVSNNSIGIYLWDCSNNNILTYNTVNFNSFYGIGFFNALNNNIYLNNFNNSWNVRPSGQTNTSWNSTSKINYQYSDTDYSNYLGNYWSDYNGSDNDNDGIGDTSYSIDSHHDYRPLMQPWENYFAPPENQLPIAQFTCVPPNPAVNETVSFNASESYDLDGFISLCEFEFGDGTNGTGEVLAHAYSSVGEYTVNLTVTDNEGATNRTSQVIRVFPDVPYFDTEPGTYPSICGTHNGTIEMTHTVNVSEIFIYSCVGTGGHIKYAKIWNASWGGTEAHWSGYTGDWHTCSFDKNFTLVAGETYNYTIYTGSYSQVHHKPELLTAKGWITCTEFTDVNGKRYCTWIPAIRLE